MNMAKMDFTKNMKNFAIAVGIAALSTFSVVASAEAATKLGTFKVWTAWTDKDANGKICYISATPGDSQPTGVNRSPIHFIITHREGSKKRNEVATLIGYPFKPGAEASATVDGKAYPMVTDSAQEAGWLASTADEAGFVAAMKRGSELVVRGISTRGTRTTDTYSLSGVTAAMNEIDKSCK
ncbi:invasion associated locus B family protein [Maritalea sp.]|uniref:invasion associated locus B family protein n=1 Tax=Maritalea sp. TaxID=2003361 RepID=UPI003EF9A8F2